MTVDGAAVANKANRRTVLSRLQLGIESLYRVNTQLNVEAFLLDEEARRQSGVARAPREQLLINHRVTDCGSGDGGQGEDELRIGLFLDQRAIANLEKNDPARRLDGDNFADFCLAVEGVSHFIYVAICAAADRSVSALELELQAEVDKFACCFLVASGDLDDEVSNQHSRRGEEAAQALTARLYDDISYAEDLDADERSRYRVANLEARRYTKTLSRSFVAQDRVPDMLHELRSFYRLTLDAKLGHIARLAA